MPRIKKRGLDYFPMNTDFIHDRLVRRIMKQEGDGTIAVLLEALSYIYAGEGYYVLADSLFYEDLSAGLYEKSTEEVMRIIRLAVEYGLFDRMLFEKHAVLTSLEIQRQYLFSTKRRAAFGLKPDYCLLSDGEVAVLQKKKNAKEVDYQAGKADRKTPVECEYVTFIPQNVASGTHSTAEQRIAEQSKEYHTTPHQSVVENIAAKNIASQQSVVENIAAKNIASQQSEAGNSTAKGIASQQIVAENSAAKNVATGQNVTKGSEVKNVVAEQGVVKGGEAKDGEEKNGGEYSLSYFPERERRNEPDMSHMMGAERGHEWRRSEYPDMENGQTESGQTRWGGKQNVCSETINALSPPVDGKKRNYEGLLYSMRLYRVPLEEQYDIILKSDFGIIGHPVWKGFVSLRDSNGKIKLPGRYLLSIINK